MIYFDNSASSPLSEEAKKALFAEAELFANPSSLHSLGFESEKRMKKAREEVAKSLGALPEEIIFTSGGTEADNLAIFGAARKMRRRGKKILSSDSEHPAVEKCLQELEKEGFEVVRLSTKGGALSLKEIETAADETTILAAVMHTNNETGAVYDIASLSRIVKQKNPEAIVFSDLVQGYLKTPLSPKALGLDLASLSSHKINGPKGVGALYIRKGLNLPPVLFGGGQEKGLRSGTENLLGIASFGTAARLGCENLAENIKKMNSIREFILKHLADHPKIHFNLPQNPSCHILSMQVEGFRSEVLLHSLSAKNIFISSGSACSSHSGKSPVLKNFGLNPKEADSTVRLSFSPLNTIEEAQEFCQVLKDMVK